MSAYSGAFVAKVVLITSKYQNCKWKIGKEIFTTRQFGLSPTESPYVVRLSSLHPLPFTFIPYL